MRPFCKFLWFVPIFLLAPTLPLFGQTPAEVACEEAKLGRLIHRFSTLIPGDNLFLWSAGGEDYSGLAVSGPFRSAQPIRDELQISFDLKLQASGGLLNPKRLLLPQAILVRRDPATNLSATEPVMSAWIELALQASDPTQPLQPLLIAGRLGRDFGAASGAARSLEAENLFERCSAAEPSAFDLAVFEILSRTFRVTDQLKQPFPGPGQDRYKTIFFRDVEPLTYRAKVFSYLTACDPRCRYSEASFQLRIHFALADTGKLAAGRIEALRWCLDGAPPPCTAFINPETAVIVAPPIFAGHETQPEAVFRSGAFLNVDSQRSPENILTDDVPWPQILRGTAWDRPLGTP